MMKYKRLYLRLTAEEMNQAEHRYHFDDNSSVFFQVYKKLVKQIDPVLYYEYDQERMTVAISLGEKPDQLLHDYENKGSFLHAYAVECLSMELLSVSYRQLKEIVYRERRQFLQTIHFCDLEEMRILIPKLGSMWNGFPIKINDACMLIPSKSVVFYGIFGNQACTELHVCSQCKQKNCIFRKRTGEEDEI